jgi:hypothetical protein
MKKKVYKPRSCDVCGGSYSRRDLVEVWTSRNPGHRIGWVKMRVRRCHDCATLVQSQRLIVMANIGLAHKRKASK